MSYRIAGPARRRTAFQNMINTCHAAGVKVVVDTVINHMSAGSRHRHRRLVVHEVQLPRPVLLVRHRRLHRRRQRLHRPRNVQNCELVGLADLDTGEEYVRRAIAGYMNDLLSLGVDGFRIDAAKHIPAADLANIKSRLTNPSVYWKQEVIYGAGEAVQPDRVHRQRRRPGVPLRLRPQAGLQQREPRLPEELRGGLGLYIDAIRSEAVVR